MRKRVTVLYVVVCMLTTLFGSVMVHATEINQVTRPSQKVESKEERDIVESQKRNILGKQEVPDSEKEMEHYLKLSTTSGEWIQADDGRWWYMYSDGTCAKNGWEYINGEWYYFDNNGWMLTGWQSIGGSWYYLGSDGRMCTGWQSIDGSWYYFNTSGVMERDWVKVNGSWYYLGSDGSMRTGWQSIGGSWYYLGTDGSMRTGWHKIKYPGAYSGNAYYNYFNSNGEFVTDSDYRGCNHGYPTFGDYRYSISPKNVKYYSYCSAKQNVQIGIGAAAWNKNEVSHISKASTASQANMLFYSVKLYSKNVLASTVHYINGEWGGKINGNWTKTRINIDSDSGIISSGTIAHEIGHAYGLSHRITDPYSIMCQLKYGREVDTVQYTDLETLRHIY